MEPIGIQYWKVFVSWPFCIFILIISFGIAYRKVIGSFIKGLSEIKIKLPGGPEFTSQSNQSAKNLETSAELVDTGEAETTLNDLLESKTAQLQLEEIIEAKDTEIKYWEFSFLSYFLVHNTKRVLYWFSTNVSGLSRLMFHSMWSSFISNPKERKAILDVLLTHDLIVEETEILSITPKGKDFVKFANLKKLITST